MATTKQTELVETREQRHQTYKSDRMFVSKKHITSLAVRSLRTAAACKVFLVFLTKCQWKPIEGARRRKKEYYLANQGEIQFTYNEAKNKWGIGSKKFTRALDELIRVGLIDIARTGYGLHKDVTLYAISDRWEKFGADEFVAKKRRKRKQQLGFTNRKQSQLKQTQRSPTTVEQQSSTTVETKPENVECLITAQKQG